MSSASSANLPRIMSASGRTLRALIRAKRCDALNGMLGTCFRGWCCGCSSGGGLRLLRLAAMTLERPRRRELAQSVADHILRHEDFHVNLAVVDHEGQAHKLGHDRASTGPRLDRLFRAAPLGGLHLLVDLEVHKRTFFLGSAHVSVASCQLPVSQWFLLATGYSLNEFDNPISSRPAPPHDRL